MSSHQTHRQQQQAAGGLPAVEWCDYPGCVEELWHEGDHNFDAATPRQPMRVLQLVNVWKDRSIWCECCFTNPRQYAWLWAIDALGKTWMMCVQCLHKK